MRARIALSAVTALTALLGLIASPAHAADPAAVEVVIDTLDPALPTPDAAITVSGRVLNTSGAELIDPTVRLRMSSHRLDTRDDVTAVLAAELNPADGSPDDLPFDATRIALGSSVQPGDERSFTLRLPAGTFDRHPDGVYALGVEVQGADGARLGVERTVVPVFDPKAAPAAVGLTWLWPLADRPAQDASGTFIDDALPTALASGGRLHELVDLGAEHPWLTWVIDPDLLQAATDVADGYQVQVGTEAVVGDHAPDGQEWLEALSRATRNADVQVLPYADVDAGALRRAKLDDDVVRAVTWAPQVASAVLNRPIDTTWAWAPSGRFDKQTANLLANAGVRTVVLDAAGMPLADGSTEPASGIAAYGTQVGPIEAVLTDPELAQILTAPQSTANDVLQARQRFLAETALIAQNAVEPVTLVVAPDDLRWAPSARLAQALLDATTDAPWLRPRTMAQLRESTPQPRTRRAYGTDAKAAELPATYVARIAHSQQALNTMGAVITEPSAVSPPFHAALLRSSSSTWRDRLDTGRRLIATIDAQIAARTQQVHVLSSGTVTFSGDSGRIPVTIANDSTSEVTVGLALNGIPRARLVSSPQVRIAVEPGHKVSVEVEARVVGGEPLTVEVQLLTPAGTDYGVPARISLTSTAYARAAAGVMVAAFAGIAIFVFVGIVRRIRTVRDSHMAR